MRCGLGTKWFNGILSMIRKQGLCKVIALECQYLLRPIFLRGVLIRGMFL